MKPTCYDIMYVTKLGNFYDHLPFSFSILRQKKIRSAFLLHHKRLIKEFSQVCVCTLQWCGNWSHHLLLKFVLLESFVYLSFISFAQKSLILFITILRVLLLNWGYIAIMQLHFFMTTITYIYNLKILCKLQILSLHALIHISY